MVMTYARRAHLNGNCANTRLRLKHLQMIEALERTGSIGKAADEFQISQSAASKILQDAEKIFGAALFSRHTYGLVPTPVGAHVAQYAQRCLNETGRVMSDVDTLKAGGAGTLYVGAIMGTMPHILPEAIKELRERKPLLLIHLTATTSDEILVLLEQRRLEIGVCRLAHVGQELMFDFEELFDETYWVFVDKNHPLASAEGVDWADLEHLPWVLQPWPSPSRQVVESAFARSGVSMSRSRVETTSRLATLNLVRHAGMIGLLPTTLLFEAVDRGDFVKLELEPLMPPSKYGLVTRRGEPWSEHALDFASILRSRAKPKANRRKLK